MEFDLSEGNRAYNLLANNLLNPAISSPEGNYSMELFSTSKNTDWDARWNYFIDDGLALK